MQLKLFSQPARNGNSITVSLEPRKTISTTEFSALWKQHCPHLPQPKTWSSKRKQALRARCREDGFIQNLETALTYFGNSRFARGENDRNWTATVDTFLRPGKWAEIIDGFWGKGKDAISQAKTPLRNKPSQIPRNQPRRNRPRQAPPEGPGAPAGHDPVR